MIPLEITKSFIKIKYENHIGYADITHFVSRADFANLAYHPKKNWLTVLYRNNNVVITQKGEAIPLEEIKGYVANTHRGVVVEAEGFYGPPIRARVEILKPEAYVWGSAASMATVRCGEKERSFDRRQRVFLLVSAKSDVSTDSLMKQEIYSIAFENKNSVRGLVSSSGVYRN